jgi:hypothetical protein
MSTESVPEAGSDPLKAIADAMDAAVQAAKDGVAEVGTTASDTMPALGRFLSRCAYKTCYSVSYGVVFPTLLVARSIPKDNAAVHGLIDGAHAAMDAVADMKAGSESVEPVVTSTVPSGSL